MGKKGGGRKKKKEGEISTYIVNGVAVIIYSDTNRK